MLTGALYELKVLLGAELGLSGSTALFLLPIGRFQVHHSLYLGKAWDNLLQNKTAFTSKKNYGKEEREAQWALAQRTLHGLQPLESSGIFNNMSSYQELSEIAKQVKRRAEVARMYIELISTSIAEGRPFASKSSYVKLLRSVKCETLKLIETFVEKTEDQPNIGKQFVPPMMVAVLGDYAINLSDAREPEVLSLFATLINKDKGLMVDA